MRRIDRFERMNKAQHIGCHLEDPWGTNNCHSRIHCHQTMAGCHFLPPRSYPNLCWRNNRKLPAHRNYFAALNMATASVGSQMVASCWQHH